MQIINIMNDDGTLNAAAGGYEGLDRFAARKKLWEDMEVCGCVRVCLCVRVRACALKEGEGKGHARVLKGEVGTFCSSFAPWSLRTRVCVMSYRQLAVALPATGARSHALACWTVALRCAVLCCAVLCCAVLCCAVLCCAVLCCAVLCRQLG
jgi:hypothetical protein